MKTDLGHQHLASVPTEGLEESVSLILSLGRAQALLMALIQP